MNLHVITVYYPAGALVLSVVLDLVAQATGRERLADAAWWALVGGMGFALLAMVTGIVESPIVDPASSPARGVLGVHSTLAYVSVILFGVLALWRLTGRGRIAERWRPAYLAAAVIAAVLLLVTVYTGVRSVYGYATGIPADVLESALDARREAAPILPGDTSVDTVRADTLRRDTVEVDTLIGTGRESGRRDGRRGGD